MLAKKSEILPFATTWMDLEGIVLSEISHTEMISYDLTYMWNLKNKANKKRHRYREYGCQRGGG